MTGTTKKSVLSMEVSPDTAIILLRLDTLEGIQKDIMELLRGEGDNLGIVAQVKVNTGKLDNMEDAVSCVEDHVIVSKTEHDMLVKHEKVLFGDNGNVKNGLISRFEYIEKTFSTQGKIVLALALGVISTAGGAVGTYIVDRILTVK